IGRDFRPSGGRYCKRIYTVMAKTLTNKSFLLLFYKKEVLASLPCPALPCPTPPETRHRSA
ncbi:hypothetical protein, partial [Acidiphilium rubrum]|uniref:hypothetical protein n=2 Tax=Acidiphilium TaxID=522 RepID=UPI002CD83D03